MFDYKTQGSSVASLFQPPAGEAGERERGPRDPAGERAPLAAPGAGLQPAVAPLFSHFTDGDSGRDGARPVLRLGSRGPAVVDLQNRLNQSGASLLPDGQFGGKTRAAVMGFQRERGLTPDGVVGAMTWAALDGGDGGTTMGGGGTTVGGDGTGPGTGTGTTVGGGGGDGGGPPGPGEISAERQAVAQIASAELGNGVHAKAPGGVDESGRTTRKGFERLAEYFNTAAPGSFNEGVIKHLVPGLPDWCGIFALWALKTAGRSVGNWRVGTGISGVAGMKATSRPQPGDVGYLNAHQHHCVITEVSADGQSITTIDGNSGMDSTITRNTRGRGAFAGFYTAFP